MAPLNYEDEPEPDIAADDCACGHVRDEHGHDPKYPGSTACTIEGCDCIAFDPGA